MSSPLPIDTSGIDDPLPDPSHEAIRSAALLAIQAMWTAHESLVADLAAAKTSTGQQIASLTAAATALQAQVASLQAQVAALTPPPIT